MPGSEAGKTKGTRTDRPGIGTQARGTEGEDAKAAVPVGFWVQVTLGPGIE